MTPDMTSPDWGPEILPTRARYAPGEDVAIECRNLCEPIRLSAYRLGELIRQGEVGQTRFDALPPGGYGIEAHDDSGRLVARTAVEVGGDSMRYGFVTSFGPETDIAARTDLARRLHLTDIQFYDWAYRHANLVGGGRTYADPLGQPVSLATVTALCDAFREAGSRSLGYSAVYGVGAEERAEWSDLELLASDGTAYDLGQFLWLIDPAHPRWLAHYGDDLERALEVGFDGFHLDQYGWPKAAVRRDGTYVDVAESFATTLTELRRRLPDARLVFNQVNDFPTWRTSSSPQDALYIEVWPPHETLGDLAGLAIRTRTTSAGRPVVVSAYQSVYGSAASQPADLAVRFTMATLFSHGATHLLCGEADRVLIDPYYVRSHPMASTTAAILRRWYDFLVEHSELLMADGLTDVTGSTASPYNDDIDVTYADAKTSWEPVPGRVWRRVVRTEAGDHLVHLVNLTDQTDTLWDAPREPVTELAGTLRLRIWGPDIPRVQVADPDGQGRLIDCPVIVDGVHATADLPPLAVWQLVRITHPVEA